MANGTAPNIKRLVDLVDRGPEDDLFFPQSSNSTLFRREWPAYHNVVMETVEIGYQGNAAWGNRITVNLTRKNSGDLLQWICLRLQPRTWLGPDLETKLRSGAWDYADPSGAWMWAASLGSIAIKQVELEIGDAVIEKWPGEWMDIWSRVSLDGGRAAVWDSDIYGQLPPWEMRDTTRPPWTTVLPTEDGYVYCWLPLAFLRRPQTAFPLVAVGEQEIRLHITLRPFHELVRMRARPRSSPADVPLGKTLVFNDVTGTTPIPWEITLPKRVPDFEDTTVFAGVVHTENPLRGAYMRVPMEMIYEPVTHMSFDISDKVARELDEGGRVKMNLPLTAFNGPIREICWILRRKAVWEYNEWTNYGALLEEALVATDDPADTGGTKVLNQEPLMTRARLRVGNAVWRDEAEDWWRLEYGLAHRGGVRAVRGMVYGFALGDAARWTPDDLQPAGTVNASKADMRLEIEVKPPKAAAGTGCTDSASSWEVHVFGIGVNWLRFVNGLAVPLFKD